MMIVDGGSGSGGGGGARAQFSAVSSDRRNDS